MTESDQRPPHFMFDEPPWWLVLAWVLAPFLAICTVTFSARSIRQHMRAATAAGFGHQGSFGPRGDKIIFLLGMPAMYSILSLLQVFMPDVEPVSSFCRSCIFGVAATQTIQLNFLLAGGKAFMEPALPKTPVKAFNQAPCCCLFCWPCCARPADAPVCGMPQPQVMLQGIKQFIIGAPLIGLCNLLVADETDEGDTRGIVLTTLYAISTIWCMWSFKSLNAWMGPVLKKLVPEYKPDMMAKFVVLHMVLCQVLDLVLQRTVQVPYDNGNWVLEHEHVASIVGGVVICILEVLLCVLGGKAFPVGNMYPKQADYEFGLPIDMIAAMELHGVDASMWKTLALFGKQPSLDSQNVLSEAMV